MTILIVAASLVLAFFFFPLSTIDYVNAKAMARFAAWKELITKEDNK